MAALHSAEPLNFLSAENALALSNCGLNRFSLQIPFCGRDTAGYGGVNGPAALCFAEPLNFLSAKNVLALYNCGLNRFGLQLRFAAVILRAAAA